jgi:hypothetical protein
MKKLVLSLLVFLFVIIFLLSGFSQNESISKKQKSKNDSIFYENLKKPWKSYKVEYKAAPKVKKPNWQPGYHPERGEDEIFIDNILSDDFKKISYNTKRLGRIAYDMDGHEIKGMRPVFVKQKEMNAR